MCSVSDISHGLSVCTNIKDYRGINLESVLICLIWSITLRIDGLPSQRLSAGLLPKDVSDILSCADL